jgi:hypothetical protein
MFGGLNWEYYKLSPLSAIFPFLTISRPHFNSSRLMEEDATWEQRLQALTHIIISPTTRPSLHSQFFIIIAETITCESLSMIKLEIPILLQELTT